MKYSYLGVGENLPTKQKIFLVALDMFAAKGYSAVSVQQIAEIVGIKSASVYNHYPTKQDILDAIINYVNDNNRAYYKRLDVQVKKTTSYGEVLDCLFAELFKVKDIKVYYGVAILSSEQFSNAKARVGLQKNYLGEGIDYMEKAFNHCIASGWVEHFNARAAARTVMNAVYVGSLVRVQEHMGEESAFSAEEMFRELREFLETPPAKTLK